MNDNIKSEGFVDIIIDYVDGRQEIISFKNTVLRTGRIALAKSLANEFGSDYDYYITSMLFGNGGTVGGVPKVVSTTRSGLFGTTLKTKNVSVTLDPVQPTQVTFTSVLTTSDCNGEVLNEMALRMNDGDLYSMATFPDLNKTSAMALTWVWSVNFI